MAETALRARAAIWHAVSEGVGEGMEEGSEGEAVWPLSVAAIRGRRKRKGNSMFLCRNVVFGVKMFWGGLWIL